MMNPRAGSLLVRRRVVISIGTDPGVEVRAAYSPPRSPNAKIFCTAVSANDGLAINTEFSPDELSRPPARYDSVIGPGDRSLSKSGDAETVAQKIRPDVGA